MGEKKQIGRQEQIVIGAVLGIMVASIAVWQYFHNEALAMLGLAVICGIAAVDCFLSIRLERASRQTVRRRFFMGVGAVIMLTILLYLVAVQLIRI